MCNSNIIMDCVYHNIKKKCFFFDTLIGTLDNSLFSDKDRFAVQSLSRIWPHGLQHARLPCPALSSGVSSNSCLLNWLCHRIILSSVSPFSSCPHSFPESGSFPMSWHFASGGQSIGISASASVLLIFIGMGWFPLGLIGLILLFKGLSRFFSRTTVQKYHFFSAQLSLCSNSHL